MPGACRPQPGTTLGVTSSAQHCRAYGGAKGVPLPPQCGGCRAGTGGISMRVSFGRSREGPETPLKGPNLPQSSPAPTHKASPGAERFFLSHPSKEPLSCPPPRGAQSRGSPPPRQQRTYHFVVDGGRCRVVVRIHSRRDGPSVAQIVVLRRDPPPSQKQRHVRGVWEARERAQGQTPAQQQGQAQLWDAQQQNGDINAPCSGAHHSWRPPIPIPSPPAPSLWARSSRQEGITATWAALQDGKGGPEAISCCKPPTRWHFEARLCHSIPAPMSPAKVPLQPAGTPSANGHSPLEN